MSDRKPPTVLRGVPDCPDGEVPWISVAQMRAVDRETIGLGLDLARMMENAGANLAWLARGLLGGDVAGRRVTVLAGRGGNGGGGLVAARRLTGWGALVDVRLAAEPSELAPVPRQQLEILRAMDTPTFVGAADLSPPELLIDAILGYSQQGSPRATVAYLIAVAHTVAAARDTPVLSLDVPSGLELDDGMVHEPAVRATATMTLALPKAGLRVDGARSLVGELYLADVSIPPVVYEHLGIRYRSPFTRGPIVRLK